MSEKVILEGRSAEDLIDLFRREGPLSAEIKAYFTAYCDCDLPKWLIAQIRDNNTEVVDKVKELIAAYDPYPITRVAKFPVHGHLVKTFCDGQDLKGYYAINSQGLQSYDKRLIIANSPNCGVYIIKDSFKLRGNETGGSTILSDHVAEVGVNVYKDGRYSGQLWTRPEEIYEFTPDGMKILEGFKYFGQPIESIFESQGFSYVETIPWSKRKFEMSLTAFFPLIQGQTDLAHWPIEMSLGFGFGGDSTDFIPNTWVGGGVNTVFSFHRYDKVLADKVAANPGYYTGSRFDPRSRNAFFECRRNTDAGFQPSENIYTLDPNEEDGPAIPNAIASAIAAGTATGTYRSVVDAHGNIPNFFCLEKRSSGGTLLGYELTVSIRVDADTKTLKAFVNGIEITSIPFTIDFREMHTAWYPQVYMTASGWPEDPTNEASSFYMTDFTVKELTGGDVAVGP